MKNCYSDFGRKNYNKHRKICPFACCSCFVIECCCCCHCTCHQKNLKKNRLSRNVTTYTLFSPINQNSQKQISLKETNFRTNNLEDIISNESFNRKNYVKNKYYSMIDDNRPQKVLNIDKDLIRRTNNLANEVKILKEKIRREKENMLKNMKNEYDISKNRINLKKIITRYNRSDDHKNNYDFKDSIKKIYLPIKKENCFINKNRYIKEIDTSYDFFNTNINEDENKFYNKISPRKFEAKPNNSIFNGLSNFTLEKYKKLNLPYYNINKTESSFVNNNGALYSQRRGNEIILSHFDKNNNDKYNSFLTDRSMNKKGKFIRSNPICFNNSNISRKNCSNSYNNKNRRINMQLPSIQKNKSYFLNNKKLYKNCINDDILGESRIKNYNNNRYNSVYSKKNLYPSNANPNLNNIKKIELNKNGVRKQKQSPDNYKICKKFFSISKSIDKDNKIRNIYKSPILKKNHFSYKNRENNHFESFKKENNEEENSLTKYNTEINFDLVKSEEKEENNQIDNDHMIKKEKKNKPDLISKLNIDTNLSINNELNIFTKLNKNIEISSKTVFTIYEYLDKIYILCFDFENRKFSLRDFADYNNFEQNYKLSLKSKENKKGNFKNREGNLFLMKGNNLYIVTGKNYDMLYSYDPSKKAMYKLCSLKNNHSNGGLISFNDNSLLCISGDYNKKVELFSISKNEWNDYLSETLIERSYFSFCAVNQRFIFLIFGKNYPTNEYLNTIEYYDLKNNSKDLTGWKYLNFVNKDDLTKMNICNGYALNFNDKKIILVGGYNGLEKKNEQYFTQIILANEDDLKNNANNTIIERTERKFKDIDKKKKYYFNGGGNIIIENKNDLDNNKEIYFSSFDNEFNCHVVQISNLAHDVYYNKI